MVKIEDLKAYEQLTEVMPAVDAKRQLFIALNTRGLKQPRGKELLAPKNLALWELFLWFGSKQGYDFWFDIANEIDGDWRNKA